MYINPGELNKKIMILALEPEGTDSSGFPLTTPKVVRSCYAKVTNTSGSEAVKENSEFSSVKKRFLVRYSEQELNTDMIIRYEEKDYDIEYINPYEDGKEYVEIWTKRETRI